MKREQLTDKHRGVTELLVHITDVSTFTLVCTGVDTHRSELRKKRERDEYKTRIPNKNVSVPRITLPYHKYITFCITLKKKEKGRNLKHNEIE